MILKVVLLLFIIYLFLLYVGPAPWILWFAQTQWPGGVLNTLNKDHAFVHSIYENDEELALPIEDKTLTMYAENKGSRGNPGFENLQLNALSDFTAHLKRRVRTIYTYHR